MRVTRSAKLLLASLFALGLVGAHSARAETPVSIELVLAVDTSQSVDGFEFALVMEGIAGALRDPEVVDRIGQLDGVAVALFQWNSEIDEGYMIPWHLMKDPGSVEAFAAKVAQAERDPLRGFTAIGRAVEFGLRQIAGNAFEGRQKKIDVSGDGRNNRGRSPLVFRAQAKHQGVVINGLPIMTQSSAKSAELDRYYREEVIAGPGAFAEVADGYEDFARAFRRKLLREITPVISEGENDGREALAYSSPRGSSASE